MGTIADKTNYLIGTKSAIKQSLINKGVTVGDTDTFRSYAGKIDNLDSLYYFTNGDYFLAGNSRINDYLSNKTIYKKMLSNITSAKNFLASNTVNNIDYIGIFKELDLHNKNIPLNNCFTNTYINLDIEDLTVLCNSCSFMFSYAGYSANKRKVLSISFPNSTNLSSLFYTSYFTEIHNLIGDESSSIFMICSNMASLTLVENLSFKKATDITSPFSGCTVLTKINNLDLRGALNINAATISLTGTTTLTALTEITGLNVSGLTTGGQYLISTYTPNLARLTFTGTSIPNGLNITNTAMVKTGIVEMFNSLPITGTAKNIVLGATKLALLSIADKAIATGKGYILS